MSKMAALSHENFMSLFFAVSQPSYLSVADPPFNEPQTPDTDKDVISISRKNERRRRTGFGCH